MEESQFNETFQFNLASNKSLQAEHDALNVEYELLKAKHTALLESSEKTIVPWRPELSRLPGFEWLLRYYAHRFGNDAVHVETDDSEEPFNKSRTINLAVSRFPGHVCVITDADVFICDWTLRESIRLANRRDFLYLPHNCICRMTQHQSRQLLRKHPSRRVSA